MHNVTDAPDRNALATGSRAGRSHIDTGLMAHHDNADAIFAQNMGE
jgi:hypothetical protein